MQVAEFDVDFFIWPPPLPLGIIFVAVHQLQTFHSAPPDKCMYEQNINEGVSSRLTRISIQAFLRAWTSFFVFKKLSTYYSTPSPLLLGEYLWINTACLGFASYRSSRKCLISLLQIRSHIYHTPPSFPMEYLCESISILHISLWEGTYKNNSPRWTRNLLDA